MTIKEIVSLIDRMADCENISLSSHAKTLRGPRTRGSTTCFGLDTLPSDRVGVEVQPPKGVGIPGCRYLEFQAPELGGILGATRLVDALVANLPVRVRLGKHGYELFVDRDQSEAEMPKTNILTVILGPDETGNFPEVVWTWHPGRPMGSLKAPISDDSAVKIHRG